VPSKALRNLAGLLFWSRRVASLARQHKPRFAWCDSIRPCTYPAKWMHERVGTKYGVFVHGGDLLKELHAIHHSRFARKTAKALLGPPRPSSPTASGRASRLRKSCASWASIRWRSPCTSFPSAPIPSSFAPASTRVRCARATT